MGAGTSIGPDNRTCGSELAFALQGAAETIARPPEYFFSIQYLRAIAATAPGMLAGDGRGLSEPNRPAGEEAILCDQRIYDGDDDLTTADLPSHC